MQLLTAYSLRPERVSLALGAVTAVLIVVHVIAMQAIFNPALDVGLRFGIEYWHLAFFDLDGEESFGTWFSAGMLVMAGMLLMHQGRVERARGAPGISGG